MRSASKSEIGMEEMAEGAEMTEEEKVRETERKQRQ